MIYNSPGSPTKLERIIFDERDIKSLKHSMGNALRYVNGEINLYSKFAATLSGAEELISEIANQTDFTENNRVLFNLWDDYYYSYPHFTEDFIDKFIKTGRYKTVIRDSALMIYYKQIEDYSPENQLIVYRKLKTEVHDLEEALAVKIAALFPFEKFKLNRLRNDPTARVNSSPSFIFAADIGESIVKGFEVGLKGE